MDIRLWHAAHHLPLSFNEAWDSSGSMNMGTTQTSHNPPPTARIRLRPQATRANNLRVLLQDTRVGTSQVLHMRG